MTLFKGAELRLKSANVINLIAKVIDILYSPGFAEFDELLIEPAIRRQRKNIVCVCKRITHQV